jgi:perosamine synthetase
LIKNKKKFWRFSGNEEKYVNQIFTKGFRFRNKSFSERLENKFSQLHNVKYSVCINSCTSALHVAFMAIGISKNDEVLVPALTPIMCGTTVRLAGGTPVYVDVDPDTFLIDTKDILKKITKKTKAILAVHMYGGICNLKELKKICTTKNLYLIEDCAESMIAKDENKLITGTVGDIGCWSFQTAKQLTCGDGGILTTNNPHLGKRIRKFSNLGFKLLTAKSNKIVVSRDERQNPNYKRFDEIGFNYRMNEFSAAIALAQCEKVNFFVKQRRKAALSLTKILKNSKYLIPQKIPSQAYSTYYTLAVRLVENNKKKLNWKKFRKKFMTFGGDGIYAASRLIHQEPAIKKYRIGKCYKSCSNNCVLECQGTPIAKKLQKELLLFTTNQGSQREIDIQTKALRKTLNFFKIN